MIKNIVFDCGGVLIDYDPMKALEGYGMEHEKAKKLLAATTGSYLWQEMDRGFWPMETTIDNMVEDHPELEEDIRNLFKGIPAPLASFVTQRDTTVPWMKKLKSKGYKIYLLSNYPDFLFSNHWENVFTFKEYLDGKIVSGFHGQMKSDPDIYKILFDTYKLDPKECVFIDDHKENIVTGNLLGMPGIVFRTFEQASRDLDKLLEKKDIND